MLTWLWAKRALAAIVVVLVVYPLIGRLRGKTEVVATSADSEVNRSLALYQAGKFEESAAAARSAIRLKPGFAIAWNNLAVAELGLHKYDEAIQSAAESIRLQPDFQLAKNNLVWIMQEKAKTQAPLH